MTAKTAKPRPITFTRTPEGSYLNTETGVIITRTDEDRWRPFRPADTSTGYVGIAVSQRTLAQARAEAVFHIANSARGMIGRAYIEAVGEHIDRAEARAKKTECFAAWRGEPARRALAEGTSWWLEAAISDAQRMNESTDRWERRTAKLADEYEAGDDDTISSINDDSTARGDAVRAELQRREEAREIASETHAEDTVHFWTQINAMSACNVNIMTTPYTFGSPEWPEVTCAACKASQVYADAEDAFWQWDAFYQRHGFLGFLNDKATAELIAKDHAEAAGPDPDAGWVEKFNRDIASIPGPGVNCVHCGEGACDHQVGLYCPTGYGRYSVELTSSTETTRQMAHRIIAETRAPRDAAPQRGPLYLPTAWSDVLPGPIGGEVRSGKSDGMAMLRAEIGAYLSGESDVVPPVLADIPAEALAMNAGYDMAVKSAWSGYNVDADAFAANVRRHQ